MLSMTVMIFSQVLIYLLLVRAVMSWIVKDYSHPFVKLVYQLTEPLLTPMQKLFTQLGLNRGGIDFSFLATFLLIQFLTQAIVVALNNAGL